jgi:hypothetical protein
MKASAPASHKRVVVLTRFALESMAFEPMHVAGLSKSATNWNATAIAQRLRDQPLKGKEGFGLRLKEVQTLDRAFQRGIAFCGAREMAR